ncbi:MAG: hypothetical protein KIT84_24785 [Labilithrix sp.]|nr:hypothetical protein [Labilithrix sp.]MCW5814267.1 hypothetical protein [Labilithrix sp.]
MSSIQNYANSSSLHYALPGGGEYAEATASAAPEGLVDDAQAAAENMRSGKPASGHAEREPEIVTARAMKMSRSGQRDPAEATTEPGPPPTRELKHAWALGNVVIAG